MDEPVTLNEAQKEKADKFASAIDAAIIEAGALPCQVSGCRCDSYMIDIINPRECRRDGCRHSISHHL